MSIPIDLALQAKREAEKDYRDSIEVLASRVAKNINSISEVHHLHMASDPAVAKAIAKSIALYSRYRIDDLQCLRENISKISDSEIGSDERDLAIRVINNHIALHGGEQNTF